MVKNVFLLYFYKDGNCMDSVEFLMKFGGRCYRGKYIDFIDVEDLGDVDFDIMMLNDILFKDFLKNIKMKLKGDKSSDKKDKDWWVKNKGGEMDMEIEMRY